MGTMRLPRCALVFLAFSWVLVALYPDPGVLVRSVRHIARPSVDPEAVADLAARLPDDPRRIEAYVLRRQIPYAYDWQSAGVPWYFPTTREALRAGGGDCESRAVVLASILTAKGIPNELRMSFDHIWVDYPGKRANEIENAGLEIAGRRDGRFFLRLPQDFDLGREIADQIAVYWTPAPVWRRVLLALGLTLIPFWNVLAGPASLARGAAGRRAPRRRRGASLVTTTRRPVTG